VLSNAPPTVQPFNASDQRRRRAVAEQPPAADVVMAAGWSRGVNAHLALEGFWGWMPRVPRRRGLKAVAYRCRFPYPSQM